MATATATATAATATTSAQCRSKRCGERKKRKTHIPKAKKCTRGKSKVLQYHNFNDFHSKKAIT